MQGRVETPESAWVATIETDFKPHPQTNYFKVTIVSGYKFSDFSEFS